MSLVIGMVFHGVIDWGRFLFHYAEVFMLMQGPLSSAFPIENRNNQVTMRALKNHLDRTQNLPLVKRISDFHLLLFVAKFLDVNADIPTLTQCVQEQSVIPEGYKLIINSLAETA